MESTKHIDKYRSILFLMVSLGIYALSSHVSAYDYTYYFNQYNIDVIASQTVETAYPSRAKPNFQQDKKDLSYRVNDVLPFEEGKHEDMYLVYPTHGIIIPVIKPNTADLQLIQDGQDFNHFKYLEKGGLHYFGPNPAIENGNIVVAAHSSYTKNAGGTYKTVGQAFIISRPGEKVFLYTKNNQGDYDLFEYIITDSYQTDKYNVGILPYKNDGKSYLTTYACYKIGSNKDRRVNEAVLSATSSNHSHLNKTIKKLATTSPTNKQDASQKMHASAPASPTITPTAHTTTLTLNSTATNIAISKIGSKQFRRKVKTLSSIPPSILTQSGSGLPQQFLAIYGKQLDQMTFMIMYRTKFMRPIINNIISMFQNKAQYEKNTQKKMIYTYISRKLKQYTHDSSPE